MAKDSASEMLERMRRATGRVSATDSKPAVEIPGLTDSPALEPPAPSETASVEPGPEVEQRQNNALTDISISPKNDEVTSSRNKKADKEGRKLYTVWLREESIEAVKIEAVKKKIHDYEVMQKIVDEHFSKSNAQ
jgi:hypothetical protein